jgi:hypothetical protein
MRARLIGGGLALAVALGWPAALRADVIHLMNGSQMQVEAWKDAGDAIEFLSGGGIVRIAKSEIRKIDGRATRGDLTMYSSGPATAATTGTGTASPADRAAAIKAMNDLLREGDALFAQSALTPTEKATAFRRLADRWREVEVPEPLRAVHGRGQQALQEAFEAFRTEGLMPSDPSNLVPSRLAKARAELAGTQDDVKQAEEEAKKQPG